MLCLFDFSDRAFSAQVVRLASAKATLDAERALRWSRGGYAVGEAKTVELLISPTGTHTQTSRSSSRSGSRSPQQRVSPLGSPRRVRRVIMQRLHLNVRRLVIVTALVFFGFLFLLASRSPISDSSESRGESMQQHNVTSKCAVCRMESTSRSICAADGCKTGRATSRATTSPTSRRSWMAAVCSAR